MPQKTLHDLCVSYVRETDKAMCLNDGTKDFWVPKSLLGDDAMMQLTENPDGTFTLTGPIRFFYEKGLV